MSSPLQALNRSLSAIRRRLFVDVIQVKGRLTGDGPPLSVLLVVPEHSIARGYFLGMLFEGETETLSAGQVLAHGLEHHLRRSGADLCIVERATPWDGLPGCLRLTAPALVRQQIELTAPLDELRKTFRDRNKTLFNKFAKGDRFAVRVSRAPEDFEHFYQRMFLPHVQRQFSGFADVDSRETLRAVFDRGFLMIASAEGVDVGATLCHEKEDALHYHRVGTLDGDPRWIKDGVQSALYVHMMLHARGRPLSRLNLGMSRPFFGDGVYRHKRNWGAVVSEVRDGPGTIHIVQPGPGQALVQFLARHPMIGFSPQGLAAYVGTPEAGQPAPSVAEWQRLYGAAGLAGVCRLAGAGSGFHFEPFAGAAPSVAVRPPKDAALSPVVDAQDQPRRRAVGHAQAGLDQRAVLDA